MNRISRRSGWRVCAVAVGCAASMALAGCGGSGAGAGGASSDGSSSGAGSSHAASLDALYEGTFAAPTGPAVHAPSGKKVWYIMSSASVGTIAASADAAKEAGAKLGWKVSTFDGKWDPNQMLTGVQQALAAKADGIIMYGVDCGMVQTGLEQAKAAGVPVVGIESQDCSPSLETVTGYAGHASFGDFIKAFGAAQAAWVIAKTNGQAKTIVNTETDTATTLASSAGQKAEFAKCSGCKIVADVKWTAADAGPALQAKIQQALVSHPEANSFIPTYDAVMTQYGGQQALAGSGRASQLVVGGGEGSAAGTDQIRSGGGMQMAVGEDTQDEAFAAVDALVRLFLKRDPAEVDTGVGIQVVDKDHNLPAKGKAFSSPVDYRSAFYKLWGVA